jgi:transposase-like protein
MSRRSFPDDVKLRVLKLAQSGKSITDICHLTKIPEKAVRNLLREYGVAASHGTHKHIDVSARTEFIRLYTEEHMKPAEIARHTGYSETSVRKTIKAFEANKESKPDGVGLFSIAKDVNDSDSIERTVSQLSESEDEPDMQYDCDYSEEFLSCNIRKLRTIQKEHKLNDVYSYDECGAGNAHHAYIIHPAGDDPTVIGEHDCYGRITFQNGPRNEVGSIHGVIDSDLLEIVRDRLTAFQSGDYACTENANALKHIEEALFWLNQRVENRAERGVLGTNEH